MACDIINDTLMNSRAILRLEELVQCFQYSGVCLFGRTGVWTSRGFAARCLILTS